MTIGNLVTLMRDGIFQVIIMIAPVLGVALVVGLIIAIFQAVTSIQEQTLTTVPKIFAILAPINAANRKKTEGIINSTAISLSAMVSKFPVRSRRTNAAIQPRPRAHPPRRLRSFTLAFHSYFSNLANI